jgi:hypothetical protein
MLGVFPTSVDTMGALIGVVVHPAGTQDRYGINQSAFSTGGRRN